MIPDTTPLVFHHEKLDVYAASLDFISLAHRIISRFPRGHATMTDQLLRAATSVSLNTAEGSGEFSSREKARLYRMALRSSAECAAVLDVGVRLRIVRVDEADEAKVLLQRIAAMLVALVRRHERAM
jgi:four helix bundle protein